MSRIEHYRQSPTITEQYPTDWWQDAFIDEESEAGGGGNINYAYLGAHGTKDAGFYSYHLFTMIRSLAIPQNAYDGITAANLYVYCNAVTGTPVNNILAQRCKRDWEEYYNPEVHAITWTYYTHVDAWQNPGGGGADDVDTTVSDTIPVVTTTGWKTWSIINNVKDAVQNRGGMLNLRFRSEFKETASNYVSIRTRESTGAELAYRPYLRVTWAKENMEEGGIWVPM